MNAQLSEQVGARALAAAKDAGPGVWVDARPVSPITVDGGTRMVATGGVIKHRGVRAAVAAADAGGRVPRGGVVVAMGPGRVARVVTTPKTVTIEWPGEAWARLSRGTGQVLCQARAEFLWNAGAGVQGWAAWVGLYLYDVLPRVLGLAGDSWRITNLEICQDFTGFCWAMGDSRNILGARSGIEYGEALKRDWAQTVTVGRRGTSCCVCLYDKTNEMGPGGVYYYLAVHAAHGWQDGQRVQRVEFRLAGDGLEYEMDDGAEIDLRCPIGVISGLGRVWRNLVYKRRMVVDGTARRTRGDVDPRWTVVMGLAGSPSPPEWVDAARQAKRAAGRAAWVRAHERAAADVRGGLTRLAVLHGQVALGRTDEVYGAPIELVALARMALNRGADAAFERAWVRHAGLATYAPTAARVALGIAMRSHAGQSYTYVDGAGALTLAMAKAQAQAPVLVHALGAGLFSHIMSALRTVVRGATLVGPAPAERCGRAGAQACEQAVTVDISWPPKCTSDGDTDVFMGSRTDYAKLAAGCEHGHVRLAALAAA